MRRTGGSRRGEGHTRAGHQWCRRVPLQARFAWSGLQMGSFPPHPPTARSHGGGGKHPRVSRITAIVSCVSVQRLRGEPCRNANGCGHIHKQTRRWRAHARTYARRLCLANQSAPHSFWPRRTIFCIHTHTHRHAVCFSSFSHSSKGLFT